MNERTRSNQSIYRHVPADIEGFDSLAELALNLRGSWNHATDKIWGLIDPELWKNRENDPTSLRIEFDGMKGREWLMKWLPSRSYDNAIYTVFSNPVGMDGDQLKNGCSMIIDPFGDIIAECRSFDDSFATAALVPEKLSLAGGYRYLNARRPILYKDIIGQDHLPEQKVIWLDKNVRKL